MIKAALEFLMNAGHGQRVIVEDREYSTKPLSPLKPPKITNGIDVSTLDGLIETVRRNPDMIGHEDMVCVVESPSSVRVVTGADVNWRERHKLVFSEADLPESMLDKWLTNEDFQIVARTRLVDDAERARLLEVVSCISYEDKDSVEDDGISQAVTLKRGVTRKKEVGVVENPFTLKPFLTFHEIEQPEIPCILRLQRETMRIGLFGSDGGAWKGDARKRIGEYLRERLPEQVLVVW